MTRSEENDEKITLVLPDMFVGQLLDGLDVLIEQWQATEDYHECGQVSEIGIRECTDAHEARCIREYYELIRETIRDQRRPR
ncbi:MAG: hypothetical protein ACF8PN_09100 [Phycisphaerales bacterium]